MFNMSGLVLGFLLLCLLFSESFSVQTVSVFHANDSPTPELVRSNGYVCEVHHVTTQDGYILELHRIPGGRSSPKNCSLPPVLLQHGLFSSSADWVIAGPSSSLGYLLADLGYDVWMGNARGNTYSKNHTTLDPRSNQFWNFSWHEMGYYDLPVVIDYILNTTGFTKLFYVGHSMGTSMFFVLTSSRPEYNDKVIYMAALAPIAFMSHVTSPIHYMAPFANDLVKLIDLFGHGEFAPRDSTLFKIIRFECSLLFMDVICENTMFLICGFDPAEFDMNILPLILGHDPAGASAKTLFHYAQLIRSGLFQQFDYGKEKNLIIYKSKTPPNYNISMISVPMTLYFGENDLLGDPTDVKDLYSRLKNVVELVRVNLPSFNHVDFLFAKHVKTLVNQNVTKWIQEHLPMSFPASPRCTGP